MPRFLWFLIMAAFVFVLLAGASWAAAFFQVGDLLGAPPPEMGKQSTTFIWKGLPNVAGHPRAWRFAYGPTHIPGAPNAVIYVSPTGQLLATEPTDLPARLREFRRTPY